MIFRPLFVVTFSLMLSLPASLAGQSSQPPLPGQQPPPPPTDAHQHHAPPAEAGVSHEREGSGTSWLPMATPMYAVHLKPIGEWQTMLHGVALVQYLRDEEPRGHDQLGSINWVMAALRRSGAQGTLSLRGMFSLEPATIRGCGYPDLLASGEVCEGDGIVDQQHPHDLVMELAGVYDRPIGRGLSLQLYGGVAGEPALGPVAFPHRPSAMVNPLAPISHHWLDASHITFGVVTGGVYGARWKAEGSLFNGREPDETRYNIDLAALDSYSGRLTVLPTDRWALQVSTGHLAEAEEHDAGRGDVDRTTASAIYHRPLAGTGLMAATLAWGRNVEDGDATHAFVAEGTLTLQDRHSFFARGELVEKTSQDLGLHLDDDETFVVGKLQAGYARFFAPLRGWRPGIGASVSLGILPDGLSSTYGGRTPLGFGVFVALRPAASRP